MSLQKVFEVAFKINGQISGNFAGAIAAAQREMEKLKRAAVANNAEMSASAKAAAQYLNQLNEMQKNAERFAELKRGLPNMQAQLQQQQQTAAALAARYRQESAAVAALKQQLEALKTAREAAKTAGLKAEYKSLGEQIKKTNAEIKAANQTLKSTGKEFESAKNKSKDLKQILQAQLQQLQRLRTALNAAGFNVSAFASSEQRLRAEIEATTRAMERQAQAAERIAALQARSDAAQNRFNDAQRNYNAATDFAQTIISPFASSVETSASFEKQMSMVKALSQMDYISKNDIQTVNKNMTELTALAKSEGLRTRYSALDAAKGETYLAYAGWNETQIKNALPAMLDLAAAADMSDLGRVADITSDIMMAFQLKPEEAQRAVDVLNYTFTHSNQNLEQLYETMKYAAPIAVGFGSSFEETAAMTKFMVDAGVKGSMAGTSMRALMTRLVAPPKTITKTLQENGLTLDDANKEWANANAIAAEYGINLKENLSAGQQMAAVVRQINTNLKDKTNQEKMAIFKAITGLYGLSGGMNLFEHGGKMVEDPEKPGQMITQLELFTRKLENSKGSAKQTASVMMDNYAGQMEILKSSFENLKIEIGEVLLPTLRVAAKIASTFVQGFSNFAQKHPRVVQAAAAIASSLAAIAVAVTGAALAFAALDLINVQLALFRAGLAGADVAAMGFAARLGLLARAFKGLAIWGTIAPFLKFGGWAKIGAGLAGGLATLRGLGAVGIASVVFGKIISGAKAAGGAIKAAAAAFRIVTVAGLSFVFSPIGASIAALTFAAYALYKNWGAISRVFDSLSETMSARLSPALNSMKESVDAAVVAWAKLFNIDTDGATDLLVRGFVAAAKIISQVMLAIVHFVANGVAAIADLFGALADVMNAAVNRDWASLNAASAKLGELKEHTYSALVEPAKDIMAIPEEVRKADSFFLPAKKADRIAQNSKAVTKADRMTGEIYIVPSQKAVERHALKYNKKEGTFHSEYISAKDIEKKAEELKAKKIQEETAGLQKRLAMSTVEAVNQYRQNIPAETISTGNRVLKESKAVDSAQLAKEMARIRERESMEKFHYSPGKNWELPKFTAPPPQFVKTIEKTKETTKPQTQTPPASTKTSMSFGDTVSTAFSLALSKAFSFSPLTMFGGGIFNKASAATPESVQTLNTTQAQAQINSLGLTSQNTAQNLSITGQNFNLASGSFQAVQQGAQETAFAFQNTNATAQMFNSALQVANSSSQQLSNGFINNNSSVAQNTAALNVSNLTFAQNSSSVQQNSAAMQNSVGSINSMSSAANNSTGAITSLSSSSSSASSSISGLGAAAQSAISSLLAAGASAVSSIRSTASEIYYSAKAYFNGGESVAQNYNGGIYKSGAFLTWFAEKSPEAAIPLDGSDRAINLWQQAGQMLGVYPQGTFSTTFDISPELTPAQNYNGGIYKSGGQAVSLKNFSADNGKINLNLNISENFNNLAKTTKALAQVSNNLGGVQNETQTETRFKSIRNSQISLAKNGAGIENSSNEQTQNHYRGATRSISKINNLLNSYKSKRTIAQLTASEGVQNKFKDVQKQQIPLAETVSSFKNISKQLQKIYKAPKQIPIKISNEQGRAWGQNSNRPILEQIFTPSSVKSQSRMEQILLDGRAALPEKVRQSKSYEALNRRGGNYPQAVTAPRQWSPKGILTKILSGNIFGALETAGDMYSRKIEIDEWEKQFPQTTTLPVQILNQKSAQIETAQKVSSTNSNAQKKSSTVFSWVENIFGGGKKPQYDELGNIQNLSGKKENIITAEDSESVVKEKKAAQEKEYQKQKRRQTQKGILNTALGIGGLFGLSKIFKSSNNKERSKIVDVLSGVFAPVFGNIFGGNQQPQSQIPIKMSNEQGRAWGQNSNRPILEQIFTPSSVKSQSRMEQILLDGRAALPEKVRQSKSYEALNRRGGNYPQAVTAPRQWSPKGILTKILSGNIFGALETAGDMYSRKIEIDEWEKQFPQTQLPNISQLPIPILHAQSENLTALNSGGTFNRLENSTKNNSQSAESLSVNLAFTITIQGNANQQDVENGVKQTIPYIQESFESQLAKFYHEKQRRVFL